MDDTPLMPYEMSSGRKNLTQGAVFVSVLFVLVVVVLAIIQGLTNFDYFIVALSLILILGTTVTMIRWVKQGGVVDALEQVATVVYVQAFAMVLLGIALLVNMYAAAPAPDCPKPPDPGPSGCLLSATSMPPGGIATTEPSTNFRPLCFKAPNCMEKNDKNDTVCVWALKNDADEAEDLHSLGSRFSDNFQDMMRAIDNGQQ